MGVFNDLFNKKELTRKLVQIQIHTRPDGDCVGSGAAFCWWLLNNSVGAVIYSPDEVPARLSWMVRGLPVRHDPLTRDVVNVSLDSPAPFMWGELEAADFRVVIDHHPHAKVVEMATNATRVIHRPDAAAVAQILAEEIIPEEDWTPRIATALFTGIHQDTGGFTFSNTTAQVLGTAARLVEAGVDVAEVNRLVSSTAVESLVSLGETLASTTVYHDGKVLCALAPLDSPAGPISRELTKVVTADVSAVFYPTAGGPTRVELRTPNGSVNVGEIARHFGGGGHDKAAGFQFDGPPEEAGEALLKEV